MSTELFSMNAVWLALVIGAGMVVATWMLRTLLSRYALRSKLLRLSAQRPREHRSMRIRTVASLFGASSLKRNPFKNGAEPPVTLPTEIRYLQEIFKERTQSLEQFYASTLFAESVGALLSAYSENNFWERMMKILARTEPIDKILLFLNHHDKDYGNYFKAHRALKIQRTGADIQTTVVLAEQLQTEEYQAPLFFGQTEARLKQLEPFAIDEKQGSHHTAALFLPVATPARREYQYKPLLLGCLKLEKDTSATTKGYGQNYFSDHTSRYAQITLFMAKCHACLIQFTGKRTDSPTGFLTEIYMETLIHFVLKELAQSPLAQSPLAQSPLAVGVLRFSLNEPQRTVMRDHLKQFFSHLSENYLEELLPIVGVGKSSTYKLYMMAVNAEGTEFLQTQLLPELKKFLATTSSNIEDSALNLQVKFLKDIQFESLDGL